jgi:hypothetical protein
VQNPSREHYRPEILARLASNVLKYRRNISRKRVTDLK